ncbi:MAG: phosphoribosylformylglycinamidine cyclo-ligase [bacterium]|nr:phosphoribosylformylglycinamidine cyclo-ligase [bacterium]MBU1918271.1 phosphoribosylformylglycinamidine cyclo-ligase [bacterium]
MTEQTTYKNAGVDIEAGNALVHQIKDVAKQTHRPEVLSPIGGFAGLFSLTKSLVKNPVLVAATDGVGTKLKLALDENNLTGIGQDLVAMCVNDLICCGAEPLFFLDYFATGKLDLKQAHTVITSMATALKTINCTLLGGETAEMPGLYQNNDFDIAGFSVGIVDETKIISGQTVQENDIIIGVNSSGPHSNGYSLIRKIIDDHNLDLETILPHSKIKLSHALLAPTELYVNPILALTKKITIKAMAHITGGGFIENIPRVLPNDFQALIDHQTVPVAEVFSFLQEQGKIAQKEMWRVFNMGIGFVLVVSPQDVTTAMTTFDKFSLAAHCLGTIKKKTDPKQDKIQIE